MPLAGSPRSAASCARAPNAAPRYTTMADTTCTCTPASGRPERGDPLSSIIELAAVVIDCHRSAPMAAFYHAACGGRIIRTDSDSTWLDIGGTTVIFREVADYQ